MILLLNLLWLVLGGFVAAATWFLIGLVCAISIIGLPWARACFNIGLYTLFPFGRTAVQRDSFSGRDDIGTGPLGFIGNLVWFFLAGWWLALGHVAMALPLAISIIGLPFAWAHLKLAGLALFPIGQSVVANDEIYARRWR